MEKTLIIKQRALNSINKIAKRISFEGFPDTAIKVNNDLFQFAEKLTDRAESFALCRHKIFYKRNNKCIPYKKNYIFIVSVTTKQVVIHNVVPAKLIR